MPRELHPLSSSAYRENKGLTAVELHFQAFALGRQETARDAGVKMQTRTLLRHACRKVDKAAATQKPGRLDLHESGAVASIRGMASGSTGHVPVTGTGSIPGV